MTLGEKLMCIAALVAGLAHAEPVIRPGGVVNAALSSGSKDNTIARGAIFAIYGENLGPDPFENAGFPLPSSAGLAGTSVRVEIGGMSLDAILVFTSSDTVRAILPSKTPEGEATITVTYNGQSSAPAPIRVVRSRFGIFAADQTGSGQASASNDGPGWRQPNSFATPARAGQTVALFGTGLGPVTFDETEEARQQDLNLDVQVSIGGREAYVLFKGRSSCCSGVDEIDFIVPDSVTGSSVPVIVRMGAAVSNLVTVAVEPAVVSGHERSSARADGGE